MDAQLKAKWIEALRSGKYKQGSHSLRRGDAYCCLGVLCDVAGEQVAHVYKTYEGDLYAFGQFGETAFLPRILRETAQIPTGTAWELVALNDAGQSFSEIADYIEAHL